MATYKLIALDDDGQEQARYPVATLPFQPKDVLIVQVDGAVREVEIAWLRDVLGRMFPPDRVLIVRDGVRFLRLEAISDA